MASQQASSASSPTAQVVGNAFVHQYYHILHQSPDLVYRFYQDSSALGRPDAQGTMSSVTTLLAINDKILSMDCSKFTAEIKTVDAQDSFNGGVFVLVTGYLSSDGNNKRNFTQSFFLAPQDKGYYVLNDMFRYVEEEDYVAVVNCLNETAHEAPPTQEQEPVALPENHATDQDDHMFDENQGGEVHHHSESGELALGCNIGDNLSDHGESIEEVEPVVEEVGAEIPTKTQAPTETVSSSLNEAPKKSYASIVKFMNKRSSPSVPTFSPAKQVAPSPEHQVVPMPLNTPAPEVSAPSSNPVEGNNVEETEVGEEHAIYIRGLPLNATIPQIQEEFQRFGPIKSGGVQVRSNRQQGFCFGFVQFESSSSMQSAIEASPVTIGGRQAYVEERRASSSRVSRGRFQNGRGGYRNDGPRGERINYTGGRGYGRGDYNYRPEFTNRNNRSSNRGGEGGGYQRVRHGGNGIGRVDRAGGFNTNTSADEALVRVPAHA